jgi:hypothetical protein
MLIEVRRELVRQDHRYLQKRFLQDAHNRIAIYIWQLPDDDEGEMLRFQVSYRDIAIDWAAERGIRLASVDDGDNPMGMKRSPVLNAENQVSRQAVERLCEYLVDHEQKPALVFIRNIIQEELLRTTS